MLLLITFALVFLRAIQQQNVIHGHYTAAIATSYAMAVAEIGLITGIVTTGWPAIPWVGTGGALGVISAMWLHRYLRSRSKHWKIKSTKNANH